MGLKMEGQNAVVGQGSGGVNLKFERFAAIPGLIILSTICYTLLGLHMNILAWF